MSRLLSRRGASVPLAAGLLLVPFAATAHAAGPPVITGISDRLDDGTVLISGSGFTGATNVFYTGASGAPTTWTVLSDTTIRAKLFPVVIPTEFSVQVTTATGTSAVSPVAYEDGNGFPAPGSGQVATTPVRCTFDDADATTITASLRTDFSALGAPAKAGVPVSFGRFGASLAFSTTAPLTGGAFGVPTGRGFPGSVALDVTGSTGPTTVTAGPADAAAPFTVGYSTDGNPVHFHAGTYFAPTLTPAGPGGDGQQLRLAVHGFTASIPYAAGPRTVSCVPTGAAPISIASTTVTGPLATPAPSYTPIPTTTPTPTATPGPKTVDYAYGLTGSATLKTLTKGSLPLTGTAAAHLVLGTGAFSADLTLAPTSGNLVALGFLPVQANVALVPQGPATGVLADAGLTANAKVRIKLPKVTLFGLQLAGGSGCQAKNVTNIALKSPGEFSPLDGGTLSGTFTISDLTNCGALTGIVSPLTAGSGNAIALKLTPKA